MWHDEGSSWLVCVDVRGNCETNDSHNTCWYPDDKSIRWASASGWWSKSGYSSESKEIAVDLPNKNYCFEPTKSYHLWYGEDDHDQSESDNHGTAKTDVYVKVACPAGYHSLDGKKWCIGTLAGCCCSWER